MNIQEKAKAVMWSLKQGFSYSPILFVCYILTQFIRATLSVYVTVLLGDIISEVQNIITTTYDIKQITYKLILFGVLNVVLWLAVEIRWRLSDDFLPLRASVGATGFLAKISRLIPLRNYDDSNFCDKYRRFQDGIHSQPQFLKMSIGNLSILYTLLLSCSYLWRMHFCFGIITVVFFAIFIFPVRSIADIEDKMRTETTNPKRRAEYLCGMFFGIYNRETRLYGLKDYYISEWAKNKRIINEIEYDGCKKISRIIGTVAFLRDTLFPLLMVGLAIFFVSKKLLLVGSLYTVWELSRSVMSNAGDTLNTLAGWIAGGREAAEAYETYCDEIKKYEKPSGGEKPTAHPNAPALLVKNADFSYIPEKKVLENINLTINKGEIVALLGENGSGKSTLIKLLLGIYTPEKGQVSVFGNKASFCEEYIREHISVAFQDFCNYPFTLRENVGFGDVDQIDNDDRIKDSLQFARADSILNRAGSLDRLMGRTIDKEGIELSGGEWQKIALARAYCGMREIMIFDEPAAKLDPLAEEKQFASIMEYARKEGKTVILVSHRVGFARMADRIIFLKDGKISESGSHADLVAKNGDYAKMFAAQREMYFVKEKKAK